jgi:GNAT superfamily N-acetyltransferase
VGVAVRARVAADVAALLPLLARTHRDEGYPVRDEAVSDWWLAPDDALGAWVAVTGDRVLGHVALMPAKGPSLATWTAGTGCAAEALAVVSRLFTDRTVPGTGTALLARAAQEAAALHRTAVLEVDVEAPAYGFYLRQGWREVGRVAQTWGHRDVESAALVSPAGS